MKKAVAAQNVVSVAPALPIPAQLPPNTLVITHQYHDLEGVQGALYEAIVADGSTRHGTTNAAGVATLENLPPGSLKIRFKPDVRPYAIKNPDSNPDQIEVMTEAEWDKLRSRHWNDTP